MIDRHLAVDATAPQLPEAPEVANIFICCLPRSGSTLLGGMLQQSPLVFHAGETQYWGSFDSTRDRCSCLQLGCPVLLSIASGLTDLQPRLLDLRAAWLALSRPCPEEEYRARARLLHPRLDEHCSTLERIAATTRAITQRRVVVEKSGVVEWAQRLRERRSWRVVVLLRDLRGVLHSELRADRRHQEETALADRLLHYERFVRTAIELVAKHNATLLRYEDLVAAPDQALRPLLQSLGLSIGLDALQRRPDRGHVVMANRARLEATAQLALDLSWREGLPPNALESLTAREVLVDGFKLFGYDLSRWR